MLSGKSLLDKLFVIQLLLKSSTSNENKSLNVLYSNSTVIRAPKYNLSTLAAGPPKFKQFNGANRLTNSSLLPRILDKREHERFMRIMFIASTLMGKHGIEHMIVDGSLLGSWRFWDLIPWDDDCDILVHAKHYDRLRHVFATQNEFAVAELGWLEFKTSEIQLGIKVYLNEAPHAGENSWRFPFLDILFYEENNTHVWQLNNIVNHIRLDYVFPLSMRPFGAYWFPTPRQPSAYFTSMRLNRIEEECARSTWDHKNEKRQKPIKFKCEQLYNDYAFVRRVNVNRTYFIEYMLDKNNDNLPFIIEYEF